MYYVSSEIADQTVILLFISAIFFLGSLRVPFHDISRSLLWQHETVYADERSSFSEIIKMSQLT